MQNGIRYVDLHCHIDLYKDEAALLRRIESLGVQTVAVTNAPSVFFHTYQLAAKNRFVHAALGLHPELVKTHAHELSLFWNELPKTRFIGEVGLDYSTNDPADRSLQRKVFRDVLERCSSTGDKVLTVHSRRAASDLIDMVGRGFRGAVILHWFSGSVRDAERAIANGLYFSVNTAMIQSKSGSTLIERMNPDFVLTETDGPFVKVGSEPASPPDVSRVIEYLAETWKMTVEDAQERVLRTYWRLIGSTEQST